MLRNHIERELLKRFSYLPYVTFHARTLTFHSNEYTVITKGQDTTSFTTKDLKSLLTATKHTLVDNFNFTKKQLNNFTKPTDDYNVQFTTYCNINHSPQTYVGGCCNDYYLHWPTKFPTHQEHFIVV